MDLRKFMYKFTHPAIRMDIGSQSMLANCNAPQESHTAHCALFIVALPTIAGYAS